MKPIIFMFSGQGSQYYQMGKTLFEQNKLFKEQMLRADSVCQDLIGTSVIEHLYAKHHLLSQSFSRTLFTHPAIFMIEHALGQVLIAQDIIPVAVLGASLGEFAASVFAGIMSFETAIIAVITQAQMLEANCQAGSMLAILGYPVSFYHENSFLHQNCELASINFDGNFIVSGATENLYAVEQILKTKEITYQRLNVSHAFHSSLINPASSYYLNFIDQQILQSPVLTFISPAYTSTLTHVSSNHFWDVISMPIKFQDTIELLEEKNSYNYLDVGPSGTLATFVKYNLTKNPGSTSKPFSILTPFNQSLGSENLNNLKKLLNN